MGHTVEATDSDRPVRRSRLDLLAGGIVGAVVLVGVAAAVDVYTTATATNGMGMGMNHGDATGWSDALWTLLRAVAVAAVVGGAYVLARDDLHAALGGGSDAGVTDSPTNADSPTDADPTTDANSPTDADGETPVTDDVDRAASPDGVDDTGTRAAARSNATDVLRVLPDDERRILQPVVDDPGLTQIEVRDRSEFSKSKVSQTITDLEKRGLLYRESQGRTYRVYPDDDLRDGR